MKILSKLSASVVALATVSGVFVQAPVHAVGGVYHWTGVAGDNKLAAAGNWQENDVPADGAQLIFPCGAGGTVNLENTLTAKVAKIETVEGNHSCTYYVIDKMNEFHGRCPIYWYV